MPLYDFTCMKCKLPFEALVSSTEEAPPCPRCGDSEWIERGFPLIGGYQGDLGGASTKPSQAGSFRKRT